MWPLQFLLQETSAEIDVKPRIEPMRKHKTEWESLSKENSYLTFQELKYNLA